MLEQVALLTIFIAAPVVFTLLFFFTAPYGRHFKEGWGPTVSARAGWILMETPGLLVIGLVVLSRLPTVSPASLFLLCLWEIHYFYRACVFPFLMKGSGKRFPLLLVVFAVLFNGLNGYVNGSFLAATDPLRSGGLLPGLRVCAGVVLFAGGFATHLWADGALRRLRAPGEGGYQIPHGGLFEYVASPNYLGEVVEWCGWALATWSLPGLAFALFTGANLAPRAYANRRWYLKTFADYPAERKSLIPFLF